MITASAPGSIFLTGEHAVIYGHRAIVVAIDQRITVRLTPRSDREVHVRSTIAEPVVTDLDALDMPDAFRFVRSVIAEVRGALPAGFDFSVASQIDPTLGLGSSAAVTIASLGALTRYAGQGREGLHATAVRLVREIQGRGSGADLAASLEGGVISYRAPPDVAFAKLPDTPPLSLKYCGYKTPTGVVLAKVAERMQGREAEFAALYARMGALAEEAIAAAEARDWPGFGAALETYQLQMEALGVSDEALNAIISDARASGGNAAIKVSGSGLGDSVVAVGDVPPGFTPVHIAHEGLVVYG